MTLTDAFEASDLDRTEALRHLLAVLRDHDYRFTTVTPRSHAIVDARAGAAEARNLRDIFGWSRRFSRERIPATLFESLVDAGVLESAGEGLYRSRVRVSSLGDRLYVHSAFPTLAADAVFFGPDTYKFVDAITDHLARDAAPVSRAVDLCTGSGVGGITIARDRPDAEVLMVDINPAALRFAEFNAERAGCGNAKAVASDLLADVAGSFDLVVAHPPYLVDRGARAYRHGGATLGADLALAIVRAARGRLSPGGRLLLFTGVAIVDGHDRFRATVEPWLKEAGLRWTYREVDPDVFGEELEQPAYAGVERIALVVLVATRPKDGR